MEDTMEDKMEDKDQLDILLERAREIAKELEGTALKVDLSNVREPERFENHFDDRRGE